MNINGIVTNINIEDKVSAASNPYKIFWVHMQDGTVFSAGIKDPGFKAGDTISVVTETKYGKEQLVVSAPGQPGQATAGTQAPTGGFKPKAPYTPKGNYTPKPFPLPMEHGDNSIIRQNSMTHAVNIIKGCNGYSGLTLEESLSETLRTAYKITEFSSGRADARVLENIAAETGE
jgi:hypothetical protein